MPAPGGRLQDALHSATSSLPPAPRPECSGATWLASASRYRFQGTQRQAPRAAGMAVVLCLGFPAKPPDAIAGATPACTVEVLVDGGLSGRRTASAFGAVSGPPAKAPDAIAGATLASAVEVLVDADSGGRPAASITGSGTAPRSSQ